MSAPALPVSVVIATVGRPDLLRGCLESLAQCRPPAADVVVVDQSEGDEVRDVVLAHANAGVRWVACEGRGVGLARNVGLREAVHDVVLLTDDDCTVAEDWVAAASRRLAEHRDAIVTGRVLPGGSSGVVLSTIESPAAREYTAEHDFAVLFTGNMAAPRRALLEFGGFDEHIRPAASDNDLCYRWLKAGRPMRYEPDLVVWHHDWRSAEQIAGRRVEYGIGQGMFYAKHLRARDWSIVRPLLRDVAAGCRGAAARLIRRRPSADPRTAYLRGVLLGLLRGWRTFRSPRRRPRLSTRGTAGE